MSDSRDALLGRIVAEVAANGLGDRSLRDLATAVGSSHRMLLYHFGSRDGLVAAIVARVEAEQRALMTADVPAGASAADVILRVWARVSAPEVRPLVRLFFETVAYAGREGTDLTSAWLDDAAQVAARLGIPADPVGTRLGVALMRGLLVDVVTGGDMEAATAAVERFVALIKDFRP